MDMPPRNILIADDEEQVRNVLVTMLEREKRDYRFFLAGDGEEAVKIAENNHIHLALVDIKMTPMCGIEAIKRLKKIDETIEIVIITGFGDAATLEQALTDTGAYDYLLKPLRRSELTHIVEMALERRDMLQREVYREKVLRGRIRQLERAFNERTLALRESQIKYRSIVENCNDIIAVAQDGYLKFVNNKGFEVSGYNEEEISRTPFLELIHPDDRAMVNERYLRRLEGDESQPTVYDFRILGKDGTSYWFESNVVRTIWEGKPATLNIVRDISERINAEKSLKLLNFALEHSCSGVGLADLEGNVTYLNDVFLNMWGYPNDEEAIGKPIQIFMHKEGGLTRVLEKLREDETYVGQGTAVRKDGSTFEAQFSVGLVKDGSGKPICMAGSFLDITEQKKADEILRREEKLSSLGQLSAGLAHELKNPLAVISSCSEFCMEKMKLEPSVRENFEVIYRNSLRASRLISELLAFAKSGRLEHSELDINEVLERTLRISRLEYAFSDISFVRCLNKGLPKLMGDGEKLVQVFINLIQNAIQAISDGGKIILETRLLDTHDMVEVSIIDDGPGIPEDYRERVFDPFFTTKEHGTGLGLSICNAITEQHLGRISIECGEKGGTRVSVVLPVKKEARESA